MLPRAVRGGLCVLAVLALPAQGQPPEWGARVQADAGRFDGVYSREGTRHGASYLRRADVSVSWRWAERWRLVAQVELDSAYGHALDEAWLAWQPAPTLQLRLGRIDPDFGLEPSTSASWTFGIERSAIWDLAPDVADAGEGHGLRADLARPGWHASLGAYDKRDHGSAVLRTVWMPRAADAAPLQLGASVAVSRGWEGDGRLRSRLAVRAVSENDAGRRSELAPALAAGARWQEDRVLALEAAGQAGPWQWQAEALWRVLGGAEAAPDRQAQGTSLLLARTLAGGPRRHDAQRARFGRPTAAGPWGHVEVFVRADGLRVSGARSALVQTVGLSWSDGGRWRAAVNLHRARSGDLNRAGQRSGRALAARVQADF